MKFFKPEDFEDISYKIATLQLAFAAEVAHIANTKLEREGKVVFCGQNGWANDPKHADKITHKALLIAIEPIEKCTHPKEKVSEIQDRIPAGRKIELQTYYQCECGVRVVPESFREVEKCSV